MRKKPDTTELHRHHRFAVYRHLPDGIWVPVPPDHPTMESAEEWARKRLSDYIVADLYAELN